MGTGVLLLLFFSLLSCSDDSPSGPLPVISWAMSGARFRVYTDEVLSLVPDVEHTDETTTYLWTMDGKTVGTENHFEFSSPTAGEYYVQFRVTNRFGQTDDEVKITVVQAEKNTIPELPSDSTLRCLFPFSEINIPIGRDIEIRPHILENTEGYSWQWQVNGVDVDGSGQTVTGSPRLIFRATEQGTTNVCLLLRNDTSEVRREVIVHQCPPAGTYRRTTPSTRRMVDKVYEYQPAPGHQVNGYIITGRSFPDGCTHEQACDTVLSHFERQWMTSLGGWGGYLVAGFDHSVPRNDTKPDLCIKGNPYDYQSEPGIIWVSQDVNGDGLPNDLWYELAGSEYGTRNHTTGYAMTYYRPQHPHMGVAWKGSGGESDYIPYMSYWNPADYYWQDWQRDKETLTFFGSMLESNVSYSNGVSSLPPYAWGYADNLGEDYIEGTRGRMGYYDIRRARTWDGKPAELEYIDFVKVQTAITGHTPNLGDASTEVYGIMSNE